MSLRDILDFDGAVQGEMWVNVKLKLVADGESAEAG
jgi:hypothetical protein